MDMEDGFNKGVFYGLYYKKFGKYGEGISVAVIKICTLLEESTIIMHIR